VYGGGGITPDIFIPEDTMNVTSYYKEAVMRGLILQFAFNYTDANRLRLKKFEDMPHLASYLKQQNLVEQFANFADKNGLKRRNLMLNKSHSLFERFIDSRIIYNILDEQAWNEFLNRDDPTIKAALEVFSKHEAFPQKPKPAKPKNKKAA
jgi:carboxyl-terminal processing protease